MSARTNTARIEEAVHDVTVREFKERATTRVRPASRYPVEVHIMGNKFLDIFHARDISAGGIGIYVPYRFRGCNIDEEMDLCITLPHERPFMAKGHVIHRSEEERPFFGVSFTMISEKNRQRIQSYIEKRLAEMPENLRRIRNDRTASVSVGSVLA